MTIKVRAEGEGKAEITVMDVIGEDFFGEGTTAKGVLNDLNALGDVTDITMRINSPGGNVWDGLAIFNMIKEHPASVTAKVEGLAASAASIIAMAADTIVMGEGSMMMIHNPMTLAMGDGDQLRKAAETTDMVEKQMINIYHARTKVGKRRIDTMMAEETWMTGEEAVSIGFADETSEETVQMAAHADWSNVLAMFKHSDEYLQPAAQVSDSGQLQLPMVASEKVAISDPVPLQSGANAPTESTTEESIMDDNTVTASDQQLAQAKADGAQEALAAETARRTEIRGAFAPFADRYADLMNACLDDTKVTADAARTRLLEKMGEPQEPIGGDTAIEPVADVRDKFIAGAQNAIMAKLGHEKAETGNEFRGMTLWQMGATALQNAGVSIQGLTPDGIARKVLAVHSTSDFPQLLSNTAGKVLRDAYGNYPDTWRQWCYAGSVSDFKVHPRIQTGSFNNLEVIPEGGEYKAGTLAESYENAQAETKGKKIAMTRQMLVNDDLGGFNRRAQLMGRAAARSVNTDAYAYLMSNSQAGPTSTDTGAYFNTTATTTAGGHANLAGSGGAPTATTIAAGRNAMRKQKDAGNKETLNILPATIVVPIALEDTVWTIINSATDISQANPSRRSYIADVARLNLVSDPYIDTVSATVWYLFADPNDAAAPFEVVFLDGVQEPFVDDMVDFETDAMQFKVRLDYGIAIGDWRGAYQNAGA